MEHRFKFGKNWSHFLNCMSEHRIEEAIQSLTQKLGMTQLAGKIFLDIGSGSGLFSLAAHRLGAQVFSFDYDAESVACTRYLKETYGQSDLAWDVERGSILDEHFLNTLPKGDIVYSWGVLHHTGNMHCAFERIIPLVKTQGKLFISIYNDQGWRSRMWRRIKKNICSLSLSSKTYGNYVRCMGLERVNCVWSIKAW